MTSLNFNNVQFVRSAARTDQFIQNSLPKIVFAGKSNVGKSSVINRILNRRNFARVGSEPGKTIHINYFLIDERAYFIDLPGYGFAKVSAAEKERWARLMEDFFRQGHADTGILIVDSRHTPTGDDLTMYRYLKDSGCDFAVVANKLDKLKKSEIEGNLENIRRVFAMEENDVIIPFSAEKGTGRNELIAFLQRSL